MNKSNRLLVACFPKSGSTYLSAILASLPNSVFTSWVSDYGRREQELCPLRLKEDAEKYAMFNLVSQNHVRYSGATEKYIEEFNLKPVVLVRNLFDVVPSLIDHHKMESTVYSMAFVPPDIVEWDFQHAAKFVTHMVLPWYFNFFLSWQLYEKKIIVRYEDLVADPVTVVKKICKYWNLDFSELDIINAIERAKQLPTRKNVGEAGRGHSLGERDKAQIREMASFYQGIDFSVIGL